MGGYEYDEDEESDEPEKQETDNQVQRTITYAVCVVCGTSYPRGASCPVCRQAGAVK
jgi:rubrerythrin